MGTFFWRFIHQIGIQTENYSIMSDDQNRFALSLQFKDNGFQTLNDVLVRLTAGISVSEFIGSSSGILVRHTYSNFVIGHSFTLASIDFIQCSEMNFSSRN